MELHDLFAAMAKRDASDLHLKPGEPPIVRIGGKLRRAERAPFDAAAIEALFAPVLTEQHRHELATRGYVDFAVEPPLLGRFRCNCFRAAGTLSAAIRRVKPVIPTLEELRLPETLERVINSHEGIVLIGGPTGSGKSTTIASMLNAINHRRAAHIITLEDPIEYLFTDDQSVIHQREIGLDVPTMAEALRSIVREDPDILLLGELRDTETVEMALHAAETGHLVFGTVHASSSVQTINRLMDLFPTTRHAQIRSNLAFNLRCITNQRLLPALDIPGSRIPAVEMLFNSPLTRKLLLDGDVNRLQDALARDADSGSEDFKRAILRLHKEKKISAETALAAAPNPEEMRMALRGITFTDGGIV